MPLANHVIYIYCHRMPSSSSSSSSSPSSSPSSCSTNQPELFTFLCQCHCKLLLFLSWLSILSHGCVWITDPKFGAIILQENLLNSDAAMPWERHEGTNWSHFFKLNSSEFRICEVIKSPASTPHSQLIWQAVAEAVLWSDFGSFFCYKLAPRCSS